MVLGAETDAGRALAAALIAAGARIAVVAARADAETAFSVQRLSRRIGAAASQAIDATNEMAVRVMTRQVSKRLGGVDLMIFCADLGGGTQDALALACRFVAREMARTGGGTIVVALSGGAVVDASDMDAEYGGKGHLPAGRQVRVLAVDVPEQPDEAWAIAAVAEFISAHGEAD